MCLSSRRLLIWIRMCKIIIFRVTGLKVGHVVEKVGMKEAARLESIQEPSRNNPSTDNVLITVKYYLSYL